jgi:peptidoglycan DL-endopeptidase CwlO
MSGQPVGGGEEGACHYVGTHPVARSRFARRFAAAAITVLTTTGLIVASGVAGAQPQPTVSQVQAKLKKLDYRENVLIQRYDQITTELKAANQRLVLVNREVAKDETAVQGMRDQIAQMASSVYEDGSMTSVAALLTASDPQTLLSQSAILQHLSTTQQQQLNQFIATDHQLLGARETVQRTKVAVAALQRQIASQRASLKKVIDQQTALLNSLTAQQRQQQLGGGGGTGGGNGGGGGGNGGGYGGPTNTQAGKAVAFAYAQLGCPYVYGGTGPCQSGFDCSGLTSQAWAAAGVSIPRTSEAQAGLPAVSESAMQPGDIMEFAGDSHVGIYVGGGYLIDAPQPGMNVEKVSIHSSWYASNFDGAVRP